MQISLFRRAANPLAAGSARRVAAARRECLENGIEAFHHRCFPANHLAIAAFEAPHTATGAHVAIVNPFCGKLFRATDVVNVIGISSVDHHIVFLELANQIVQRGVHHRRGHHQPNRARLLQFSYKIIERQSPRCAFRGKLFHRFGAAVVHHAFVAALLHTPHHVGTHPAQPDHPQLHRVHSSPVRGKEN